MNIESLYKLFKQCKKVTTDSRLVEQDSIFFALKGENFNGNEYAKKAIEKGSLYAVIDNINYKEGNNFILVDDTLKILQELAIYHRNQLNVSIIGITGTNGKTTTKELIASVLSKKYHIEYTKGNLNNHIGVPLTLLSMNENTEIGIVEMGANHPFEIKQLCEIAKPNFGVITNIGKAHLEGFGSFENVIKTKSELYDYIKQNNGKVFYNGENKLLDTLVTEKDIDSVSFGSINSSVQGKVLPTNQFLKIELKIDKKSFDVKTNLIGNYNFENVLASASIGNFFKIESEKIVSAIENYIPKNNRSQFHKTEKNNLILDAYNANPTSVEAALRNFNALELENKCIILGDMLELGIESLKEHQKIIDLINDFSFRKVILVGPIYSSMKVSSEMIQFKDVNELKSWIESNKIVSSNVLIKGSRGIQLEKIVENL